jgi:uncharacterized protein (TIGR02172 family)
VEACVDACIDSTHRREEHKQLAQIEPEMTAGDIKRGPRIGVGRTAEVYAWGDHQILKLYRADMPREWVHHEARIGQIVADAGVHAPAIGDTVEVDGRLGILYERITGPSMLDALAHQPWRLPSLARQFAQVHATMHACARPELPSQRQSLSRAIAYASGLDDVVRQRILVALDRMPGGESVCHGDYHPGNIILSPHGPVVIDWMTACHGNALADVARTMLLLRVGVLPQDTPLAQRVMTPLIRRAFLAAYLKAYRALRSLSEAEIEAWLPILAAARLNEGIEAEKTQLHRLANSIG